MFCHIATNRSNGPCWTEECLGLNLHELSASRFLVKRHDKAGLRSPAMIAGPMQTVLQRSALPLITRHSSQGRVLLRSGSLLHCRGLYYKASSAEEASTDSATGQVACNCIPYCADAACQAAECARFEQVISKEANFVKVKVQQSTAKLPSSSGQILFCTVRALLKKIKQTVLVGDHVQVAAIDWIDKQGLHLQTSCECCIAPACTQAGVSAGTMMDSLSWLAE